MSTSWFLRKTFALLIFFAAQETILSQLDPTPHRFILKVGYTTFENPDFVREGDSTLGSVKRYLETVSEHSRWSSRAIDFNIYLGNYYQIHAWLEDEYLDAAIVSPFTAYLLGEKNYARVAQFEEHGAGQPGHRVNIPMIASSNFSASDYDPVGDFENYLRLLLGCARSSASADCAGADRYTVVMVAHLSTSGFIAPLAFAKKWLWETEGIDGVDSRSREIRDRFWKLYFDQIQFKFSHTAGGQVDAEHWPNAKKEIQLHFSYSGRHPDKLKDARWRRGKDGRKELFLGDWKQYAEWLRIPNDILVVRISIAEQLIFGRNSLANTGLGGDTEELRERMRGLFELPQHPSRPKLYENYVGSDKGSYTSVRRVRDTGYRDFENRLDNVFWRIEDNRKQEIELTQRWRRWYEHRHYEFKVGDLVRFLHNDQASTGEPELAVVLPGGGVRAAYQAQMLDELYSRGLLTNPPPETADGSQALKSGCAVGEPNDPLCVGRIVGTSGGAFTGVFAALRSQQLQDPLTSLWVTGETACGAVDGGSSAKVAIRFSDVFSWHDLPRCLSFFFALFIFSFALQAYRREDRPPPSHEKPPPRLVVFTVAALIMTPVLAAFVKGFFEHGSTPPLGGLLYLAAIVLSFGGLSCIRQTDRDAEEKWKSAWLRWRYPAVLAGLALTLPPLLHRLGLVYGAQPTVQGFRGDVFFGGPTLFSVGVLAFLVLYFWRLACKRGVAVECEKRFITSLAPPVLIALVSHLFLFLFSKTAEWIAAAEIPGISRMASHINMLEVTGGYWISLTILSLLFSFGFLYLISKPPAGRSFQRLRHFLAWCRLQHSYLLQRQTAPPWQWPRVSNLLLLLLLGLLWWNWWLAPALYRAETAAATFREKFEQFSRESADDELIPLQTDLVVTAASFDPVSDDLPPGDLYFCFTARNGCQGPDRQKRFFTDHRPTKRRVLNVVFASGAAFPLLPARSVQFPQLEKQVFLIDGGYGHNVPFEAAALAGARQVLVLRNEPITDPQAAASRPPWWSGQLAKYVLKIFAFMFERSQQVDVKIKEQLVVASLSPTWPQRESPFLADFRPKVIEEMVSRARCDFGRRIGRVENWGIPSRPIIQVRGIPAGEFEGLGFALTANGWSNANRLRIEETMEELLEDDVYGPGHTAVFDFDNTCIRNDIGEAVFLQMAAERRFSGSEEFWRNIPSPHQEPLKRYWERHPGPEELELDQIYDPGQPPEFRDYLVRFLGIYDEMKQKSTRQAYAWVVRLMAGLREAQVEDLTRRVWRLHNSHRVEKRILVSDTLGTREIDVGIRVYPAVAELIYKLKHQLLWDVWIVSASSEYSVRAVAEFVNVPRNRVLGMKLKTREDNGVKVLTRVMERVTYGQGKVDAILTHANKRTWRLAAGDSRTDLEMLLGAKDLVIWIDKSGNGSLRRGWLVQPSPSLLSD